MFLSISNLYSAKYNFYLLFERIYCFQIARARNVCVCVYISKFTFRLIKKEAFAPFKYIL